LTEANQQAGRGWFSRLIRQKALWLGLVALGFVCAAYLTEPDMFGGPDFWQVHQFFKGYMAEALRAGRLPLWNPHVNLGRPFHADHDATIFYPPHLLYLVLDVSVAWALLAVLHVWLALVGMVGLLRHLGVARRLALGLALGFMATAPIVEPFQNGLIHYAAGLCYLPWVLLLALRLQDTATWKTAWLLALLVGLQYLGGHPQVCWITLCGATILLVGRRISRPVKLRATSLDLARLVGCCVWGFALAAVQIFPMLELAGQGNRHVSLGFADSFSMAWYGWCSLLEAPGPHFPLEPFETNIFCGAFVLLGGLCGLTQVRDRNIRGLLLLAVVATLAGAGNATPFFRLAFAWVPGFASFRLHSRNLVLTIFALTAATGLFLSRREPRPGERLWPLGIGAVLLVAVLAVEFHLVPFPFRTTVGQIAARLLFLAGAGALLLLLLSRRSGPWSWPTRTAIIALALLAAGDLALSVARIKPIRSRPFSEVAEQAVDDLLKKNGLFDQNGVPPRVSFPMTLMRPNAGMHFGWSTFAGYVSLTLDRTFAFMYGMRGLIEPYANTFPANNIYDAGPFPYNSMNLVLGFDPARRQAAMARPPDPRAFLAFESQTVPVWRDALAKMRRGHDFHRVVLLEAPLPHPLGREPTPGNAGMARIRHFEPERIELEVESPTAALLVLAEAWYPGWTARVNGQPAPCLPGNVWMRVVPVPAGHSTVELTFTCTYLSLGAATSGAALTAFLAVWLWQSRRRRVLALA
jgi:hypothetical protein